MFFPGVAVLGVILVCAIFFVLSRSGIAWSFRRPSFWNDVAPDADDGRDQHSLSVVADDISPDELARFRAADAVSFAVRETSHLDTRFFWVHDFEHGRLYARALFIALGIVPAQLVEVFGFASGAEGSGVAFWDDLGAIPLMIGSTGTYNTEPFQRLADLLGKDISVELESKPLSRVKQCPTKLFVAKCKTAVCGAG